MPENSTSHALLNSFLPKETVSMLALHHNKIPRDLAVEENMTILFTDMRGFTALSEQYEAHEIYRTLNANLALQSKEIYKHGGSINKFLGDGVLACFSGEDRSVRAFKCVKQLLCKLKKLDESGDYLPCHIGFGLNDGRVLLGLMGDDIRHEFSIIGDTVNTAARLCGIAGPFKALLTENFIQSLSSDEFSNEYAFVENAIFKGKRKPTRVYAICS